MRLRRALAVHWQEGMGLRRGAALHWHESVRERAALLLRWQQGRQRRAGVRTHWQETVRLRAALTERWQEGIAAHAALPLLWGPARTVRIHLDTHWQEAVRPAGGLSRMPAAPPEPPCYDPARLGLLVFDGASPIGARLLFVCRRAQTAAPPPGQARLIIPYRKVYVQVHELSAHLLPGMEPLALHALTIESDDDGFAWHLSANGAAHLVEQLAPAGAAPRRIRVEVDGLQWVFAVEHVALSRRFGQWQAQVRAASVTALLGAPWTGEQQWGAATDLTAQQIVLQALEFTGVGLHWQLPDWIVPAAAWSHAGTRLSLARRVAESAGAALRSHKSEARLHVAARYPHLPWQWGSASVDAQIAASVIISDAFEPLDAARCNAVFVRGESGGVAAHASIAATAGNLYASEVVDAFITDEAAARQRARSVLGPRTSARATRWPCRSLPRAAQRPASSSRAGSSRWWSRCMPGALRFAGRGHAHRAPDPYRGARGMNTNLFLQLQAALDAPRLQTGKVISTFGDGTALVALNGAGSARVRNPLVGIAAGQAVFVRAGEITAATPDLPVVFIEI